MTENKDNKHTFNRKKDAAIIKLMQRTKKTYTPRIIRSIMVIEPGVRSFTFFAEQEDSSVKKYCSYTKGGLISTPTGLISNVKAEITGADFRPVPYHLGTNPFDVHSEVERIIKSFELEVHKNTNKKRSLLLSQITRPLPEIIQHRVIGTVTDGILGVAVNPKSDDFTETLLNMETAKLETIEIPGKLPNQSPDIASSVSGYYLAVYLEVFEEAK